VAGSYLSLEVVSPHAAAMGENRRRLVGPEGVRIGRAPQNDWVIPDPYVSKEHARITHLNGMYFVEGLGRNPIAINDAEHPLANHEPRLLRSGDRLFIDQYEILVSVVQGELPTRGAGADLAHAPQVPDVGVAGEVQGGIPMNWDGGVAGTPTVQDVPLDPLAALGATPTPAPAPPVPSADWQQAPALASHYQPPAPEARIPEGWDRTHFEQATARAAASSSASAAGLAPSVPAHPLEADAPAQSPGVRPRPGVRSASNAPGDAVQLAAGGASTRSSPSDVDASAALSELLKGAGLPDAQLSPQTVQEFGEVLRIVVQGVMEVLQGRSEIKTQFRLPLTRVQASQNNPLKFSPNVESALHTLLVERNRAYLPTVKSFEDAFEDIRHHQMAMLEGIRVAFEHMLQEFDPQQLEQDLERGGRRGLLGLGGKSRLWELYAERYAALTRDRDEAFRRLFGDCFGEAYERQLEQLKHAGRARR